MHLIFKRIFAWLIDWTVIIVYACILFAVMSLLAWLGLVEVTPVHPLQGQLIGFLTLTLPALLYCIFLEAGSRHATLGKRVMKIEVAGTGLTTNEIVFRNILKFIPWEVAHAGILWINYIKTPETPFWIWVLLLAPQAIVIIYFMTVVATKGSRSLYDMVTGTRVRHLVNHLPVAIVFALVL